MTYIWISALEGAPPPCQPLAAPYGPDLFTLSLRFILHVACGTVSGAPNLVFIRGAPPRREHNGLGAGL